MVMSSAEIGSITQAASKSLLLPRRQEVSWASFRSYLLHRKGKVGGRTNGDLEILPIAPIEKFSHMQRRLQTCYVAIDDAIYSCGPGFRTC